MMSFSGFSMLKNNIVKDLPNISHFVRFLQLKIKLNQD